jgi:uncharacterized membrane protein
MRQLTKLLTLSCLLLSAPLYAADYQYEQIDFPGAAVTIAHGVNAHGEIVGIYFDDDGISHSFLLRNGVYKTLTMVPGASVMLAARGINASGDIVGNFRDLNGIDHGYLLRDGEYHQIDLPGSLATLLSSINNAGEIVGFSYFENGRFDNFIRKRNEKYYVVKTPLRDMHVLRSIKDNGRVLVGSVETEGRFRGFIRTKHREFEVIEYPGLPAPCSFLRFVNQRGDLLGNFLVAADSGADCGSGEGRGYLLRDGESEFQVIHFPGSLHTVPFAINDDGMIVGQVQYEDGIPHAFKAVPTQ